MSVGYGNIFFLFRRQRGLKAQVEHHVEQKTSTPTVWALLFFTGISVPFFIGGIIRVFRFYICFIPRRLGDEQFFQEALFYEKSGCNHGQ